MSTVQTPSSPGAAADLVSLGRRRGLFALLAQLANWRVAQVESLSIAAGCCGDDVLRSHVLSLRDAVQQGQTLLEALEHDEAFWGQRTIRLIRRCGELPPQRAFQQLAGGAGESLLQRPLVSFLGVSRLRRLLTFAAVSAFLILWLPILPHQRQADGLLIIRAFGRHESLMPDFYDIDIKAALSRSSIPLRELDWEPGDGVGPLDSLRKELEDRTGRPPIASCLASYSNVLTALASEHDRLSHRDRLAPSPVPMVWLIRSIRLHRLLALRAATDIRFITDAPDAGYGRALATLAKSCPQLQPDPQ